MPDYLRIEYIYPLTNEEISTGYIYLKQWRSALFDRPTTDRLKATDLIKRTYKILDLPESIVIFTKGIDDAINSLELTCGSSKSCFVIDWDNYEPLILPLFYMVNNYVKYGYVLGDNKFIKLCELTKNIAEVIATEGQMFERICSGIYARLYPIMEDLVHKSFYQGLPFVNNAYLQYCIEQLNIEHDLEAWDILKNCTQKSPYIIGDLDKIASIFEKFNPNQIVTWRKIWKDNPAV